MRSLAKRSRFVAMAAVLLLVAGPLPAADDVRDSVVKIFSTRRPPNFMQPWTKSRPQEILASGFVIEGRQIVTNAHVARFATELYVQAHQSAQRVPARVVAIADGFELALLTVDKSDFFEGRKPLRLHQGLPRANGPVQVYGFPVDDNKITVAKANIARVEFSSLGYQAPGLWMQIDASPNPGTTGGPAISEGQVVGVALSAMRTPQNTGFCIAAHELAAFVADAADGACQGKPKFFDQLQAVENPALRARLGLPNSLGGAMVTKTSGESGSQLLREGDVITHIGQYPLDRAANVEIGDGLKLWFAYVVPEVMRKGHLELTVFRKGKSLKMDLPVTTDDRSLIPSLRHGYPRYFIYGPLVFSPATKEWLMSLGGNWQATLVDQKSPLMTRFNDQQAFEGEELVVVPAPMFSHRITKSYRHPVGGVVSHVNGVEVRNLTHLVELLRDAADEFIEIKFAGVGWETLVFHRAEIDAATEEILTDNGIRRQSSDDLAAIWAAKK